MNLADRIFKNLNENRAALEFQVRREVLEEILAALDGKREKEEFGLRGILRHDRRIVAAGVAVFE